MFMGREALKNGSEHTKEIVKLAENCVSQPALTSAPQNCVTPLGAVSLHVCPFLRPAFLPEMYPTTLPVIQGIANPNGFTASCGMKFLQW